MLIPRYPLHSACSVGTIADAARLMLMGADVNQRDDNGETPMHRAAEQREWLSCDDPSRMVKIIVNTRLMRPSQLIRFCVKLITPFVLDCPFGYESQKKLADRAIALAIECADIIDMGDAEKVPKIKASILPTVSDIDCMASHAEDFLERESLLIYRQPWRSTSGEARRVRLIHSALRSVCSLLKAIVAEGPSDAAEYYGNCLSWLHDTDAVCEEIRRTIPNFPDSGA